LPAPEISCNSVPRLRWFHIALLGVLIAISGWFRLDRIDRESLTLDEYWALYLATGRGDLVFDLPYGQVIASPPNVGYQNAPAWWHIWTGLDSTTHPPLYHLVLRAWVDLFGDSDFSTRGLSWCFGLAAVPILFDAVRRCAGPWRALIAAGIMALAPAGIEFSQSARPYTMLVFLGCVLLDCIIAIDLTGVTIPRLALLALSTAALALTHYYTAGAIVSAGIFIALRTRDPARRRALAAMLCAILFVALTWGPVFWSTRHLYGAYENFWRETGAGFTLTLLALIRIPIRFLLDTSTPWPWFTAAPLALLVFVFPLIPLPWYSGGGSGWGSSPPAPKPSDRPPQLLLWWLWTICTIGVVVAVDLIHRTTMVGVLRYVYLASPAVYAILATALPSRLGIATAAVLLLCSAVYGFSRMQSGPDPVEPWKTVALDIDQMAGPRDLVAIIGYYPNEPAFDYVVISHYIGPWKRPVIFLIGPPGNKTKSQLAAVPNVWMIGHSATFETHRLLPGWRIAVVRGVGERNFIWLVKPPSPSTSPK
jgi:hypothetical protein